MQWIFILYLLIKSDAPQWLIYAGWACTVIGVLQAVFAD